MSDKLTEALVEYFSLVIQKARHDKGGPGSGNWAHAGRPGSRGGSASGGGGRSFDSVESANEWGDKAWGGAHGTLTAREKNIIRGYGGDGYEELNDYLRHNVEPEVFWGEATMNVLGKHGGVDALLRGDVLVEDLADEYASGLDAAIRKGSTPENMTVYRGLGSVEFSDKFKPGTAFRDKAFASTSMVEDQARAFTNKDGTLVKINLPKGTPSMFLGKGLGVQGEAEILLPKSTKFVITKRYREGSLTIMEVEAITS